ncbi:hypothetical protein LWF15_13495 [Kineosporia rhizophila]|uniref:ATP-grasp fold amidoligase family protein n=1 Tax=Kineosporia TaxID=49184 RepID=UPI001E5ED8B3|nr:ATP-grasp fold amidoligase family protein [Kineosporia sp. NBRC 101677]MCE0536526.1 hypothetical protein [Kineosporia rhizophila]
MRGLRLLRTRRPTTFTEKVRYKMLRDHRPLVVTFADKAAVRDYVASRVGEQYLPGSFGILDDPADLERLDLPESYVVKPTHGSGVALVVSPQAPAEATLPSAQWGWVYRHVRPEAAPMGEVIAIARGWLGKLYGQGPNREWAYSQIRPRVIVEEMLTDAHGGIPDDYKFFVFHGTCQYVQVDAGRFAERTHDFFTADWKHLPLSGGPAWADPEPGPPARLDEMIGIAEKLGSETDFVRVDLYHLPDRIVFGELTSYPAGGDSPFDPESFNTEFGRHWQVPRKYQ